MEITIKKQEETKIEICLPTKMCLNTFTAIFVPNIFKNSGVTITRKQARRFVKEIIKFRTRHKGWKLVEVHSANGEQIDIIL